MQTTNLVSKYNHNKEKMKTVKCKEVFFGHQFYTFSYYEEIDFPFIRRSKKQRKYCAGEKKNSVENGRQEEGQWMRVKVEDERRKA